MDIFGSFDFVQYWAASQLLWSGHDPYDPQLTLALQCAQGLHCAYPRITYTPPWLWLIMSPVLLLPFAPAAKVWTNVTFALVLVSGGLIAWAFKCRPGAAVLTVLATLISFPLIINLVLGQIAALLLFGAALLYSGRVRGYPALEAAGLIILSAKPHLFIALGAALLAADLRQRQCAWAVWVLVLLSPFVCLSEWLAPGASLDWLGHLLMPKTDQGVVAATAWWTGAPASTLALQLSREHAAWPKWPLIVFPLFGSFLSAVVGWRVVDRDRWLSAIPLVLCLSVTTAPFLWFSDYLVLSLAQGAAIAHALALGRRTRAVTLFVVGAAFHVWVQQIAYRYTDEFQLHSMFWFPLGILGLWYLAVAGPTQAVESLPPTCAPRT
jgi:hypothetical protein